MGVLAGNTINSFSEFLLHPMASRKRIIVWSVIAIAVLLFVAWYANNTAASSSLVSPSSISTQIETNVQSQSSQTKSTIPKKQNNISSPSTSINGSTESDSSGKYSSKLNVNGQNIPVPENGSVSKTVVSGDGNSSTTLHVHSSNTNTSGGSSSSLNVSTQSTSVDSDSSSQEDL
jgi:hypothetical protein